MLPTYRASTILTKEKFFPTLYYITLKFSYYLGKFHKKTIATNSMEVDGGGRRIIVHNTYKAWSRFTNKHSDLYISFAQLTGMVYNNFCLAICTHLGVEVEGCSQKSQGWRRV